MPWLWSYLSKICHSKWSFWEFLGKKPAGLFFLILQVNVYWRALIPRKLTWLKKILVTRLSATSLAICSVVIFLLDTLSQSPCIIVPCDFNIKILRNVNDAYSKFLEIFLSLYNECFPKIKVKLKPQRQFNPWITKGIRKSSKKRQKKLYVLFFEKKNETKRDWVQSI